MAGSSGPAAMTLIARYDATTQQIDLGDQVSVEGSKFRVISAELAQDGISVKFDLEDINK